MTGPGTITCRRDIEEGLAALLAIDPELQPIARIAGEIPLRLRPAGFEGLARIIVAQQVSVASAEAIWTRVAAALPVVDAAAVADASHEDLKACGLSRPKIATLRALAAASLADGLDLARLAGQPAAEAHAALTAIRGIGPWTADIFLLFCAGHRDIFPAGDLALQNAVRDGFDLGARPDARTLAAFAARWSPWRGIAARLFWAYYRARRSGVQTLPV